MIQLAKESKMSILNSPETTEKILSLVSEGYYDKDIYKELKISNATFKKWKDEHTIEYKKAKAKSISIALKNAQNGLMKKLLGGVNKEETLNFQYDDDGNETLVSKQVKTKEFPPDTLAIMFTLKAGDPEKWNYAEFKRLQIDDAGSDALKELAMEAAKYSLSNYQKPPEVSDEIPQ
ncbi:bacteriophage terminase small subunit [Lactococcus fujiensis]|uniref:bacteriophage terminase small subunit n=1 Tax=Lactococcus fujiensis TaxID=610251 RepID=UPI0006D27CC0|nr:bacteriophage terminase small subunit [Lactococcus fujiensis]